MEVSRSSKNYLYDQVIEAKQFIDAHYCEKINLETIASKASLSKYHFHRLFSMYYGKTPLEYLTILRINKSKELLSKGYPIKEICYLIGYESISSFIKLFKKNENLTPSLYAKEIKDQQLKRNLSPLDYIPVDFASYLGWIK